jgi:hypothetical protein
MIQDYPHLILEQVGIFLYSILDGKKSEANLASDVTKPTGEKAI